MGMHSSNGAQNHPFFLTFDSTKRAGNPVCWRQLMRFERDSGTRKENKMEALSGKNYAITGATLDADTGKISDRPRLAFATPYKSQKTPN
jgi:hypothetical protein